MKKILLLFLAYFSIFNSNAAIDLSVTNNSLGSNNVMAGSSLVVYCSERNYGSTNAGANVISVHLSFNTVLTPGANGDIWIGDINVSSCPANSTTSVLNTNTIALPTSLISGTYYIFFSADGGQVYNESDETNNFAYLPISINTCSLSTPTGLFPGGTSSNPATVTTTTPQLQWNSVPNATCYGVYIRNMVTNVLIYNNDAATTTNSFNVPVGLLSANGQYRWNCIAKLNCNSSNCLSSGAIAVYINVNSGCNAVTINSSGQPQNQTTTVGNTATFNVTANGTPPFSYQWRKNGNNISGANNSYYTTPATSSSDNGSLYSCYITNCNNSNITSSQAFLTVNNTCTPVLITNNNQPQNQTANVGGTATFSVTPSGTSPFSYQWRKNGIIITGATNSTYTTPPLSTTDNGNTYMCYVQNCSGANYIFSNSASVTVSNSSIVPTANFSVSQNIITQGSTVTTTNTSTGNPTPTYLWSVSPSTGVSFLPSSTAANPTITFANTGNYTISLTASNSNGSNSTSKTITVNSNGSTPTYWIGFYNKIEQNEALNWEKLIASGTSITAFSSLSPAKICADGSSTTIIKVNCSDSTLDMTQINCKILEGSDEMFFGDFANDTSTFSLKAIRFKHPNVMNWNQTYRPLTLQVFNVTNPNVILATYPIHLYRAPLLMVHGLWGRYESFELMESFLHDESLYPTKITHGEKSPLLYVLNYKTSNNYSFGYNSKQVPQAINHLLWQLRSEDYSAGKVDIVAHSMGGLLSRIYIEELHNNYYRGDVHKLITLNTPHAGSQLANYLWNIIPTNNRFDICPLVEVGFGKSPFCSEAIENLRVNSSDIQELNLTQNLDKFSSYQIPTYAIITDLSNPSANQIIFTLGTLINGTVNSLFFNGNPSDLIVSHNSQNGNIDKSNLIYGQWHVGSPDNFNVRLKVKDVINAIPNNTNFDMNGFVPTLETSNFRLSENNSINSSFIQISSPVQGSTFQSGNSVNISINTSSDINKLSFVGSDGYNQIASTQNINGIQSFQVQIPIKSIGKFQLGVVGENSSGPVASDFSFINILSPSSVNSISVNPQNYYIPKGGKTDINIIGYFSDGTKRNITNLNDVQFQILDSSIVTVTENNLIKGLELGTTDIIISYQDKTAILKVVVYVGEDWIVNEENPNNLASEDYIQIIPNPSNGQFYIEANNLAKGFIQIELYDLLGKKIFEEELSNNSEIFYNNIDISEMSTGIYLIRITDSNEKTYSTKIIKN